jgi:hypothetical protein
VNGSRAQRAPAFDQPGLWPSVEQFLVLTAALADRDGALAAFAAWREDLDESLPFDQEIGRLLPLLYDNLQRLGCDDPLMDRLKGAYRMNWVKTQTLFAQLRPALEMLAAQGIEIIMLKGAPLAVAYYPKPAVRPMMDLDIAVPGTDAVRAMTMFEELGWRATWAPSPDVLRFRHSMAFVGPNGQEFDLHWRILPEFTDPRADAEFRRYTVPFEFLGQRLRMPDATRMLLHSVVHGVRWNQEPPVRWVADAITILRIRGRPIDWDGMVEFAARWQLSHRLSLGLGYLHEKFEVPVPGPILRALRERRPTWVERVENRTILRDEREIYRRALGPLVLPFGDFVRFVARTNPATLVWDFVTFLRIYWELGRRREIVGYVLQGMRSRWRRALRA